MELGHKLAKGGLPSDAADSDENLGPIHRSCNQAQGSTPHEDPKEIRDRGTDW